MSDDRRKGADSRKKQRLRALLYLAEQDAEAAKLLASQSNHYAAYHCQQAVEKLAQIILIDHDIEPGLEHHLDVLIAKLPANEHWKGRLAPLERYTPYATTFRYATPGGRVPAAPEPSKVTSDAGYILQLINEARAQFLGD